MKRAILVGGPAKILPKVINWFTPLGIEIVAHYEYKRERSTTADLPQVDLVLLMCDLASHKLTDNWKSKAALAHIPVVPLERKWSFTRQTLLRYGLI